MLRCSLVILFAFCAGCSVSNEATFPEEIPAMPTAPPADADESARIDPPPAANTR